MTHEAMAVVSHTSLDWPHLPKGETYFEIVCSCGHRSVSAFSEQDALDTILGLATSVGLAAYLFYVLARPERF